MASIAAVLAALGIGLVLVVARREALVAGLALLVAAEALLAQAGGSHLTHVTNKRLALAVFGIVVLAALAVPFVRRPDLVAPAVVLFAPFRLPLHFGGSHLVSVAHGGALGRLLLLYLVLGAATAAFGWRTLREAASVRSARDRLAGRPAFLAFASLSLLWSDASGNAQSLVEYFLIPFALIVAVVGRADFPPRMPRVLGSIVVGLATLFAVVGIVEEATRRLLFQSPAVEVGNAYSNFFRVTSLFRDPSLYGRHVVVGIAVLLVALWLPRHERADADRRARRGAVRRPLLLVLAVESFAALFAVTVFVSLVAGDRPVRAIVGEVAAVVALVAGGALRSEPGGACHDAGERVTSDRSDGFGADRQDLRQHVERRRPLLLRQGPAMRAAGDPMPTPETGWWTEDAARRHHRPSRTVARHALRRGAWAKKVSTTSAPPATARPRPRPPR